MNLTYTPGTVHRYMVRLDGAFHFAVASGWLTANSLVAIRKPSPGHGRVRCLKDEERTRLLAVCRASRHPTSMRSSSWPEYRRTQG
jgi:site-specific recombinase XerD